MELLFFAFNPLEIQSQLCSFHMSSSPPSPPFLIESNLTSLPQHPHVPGADEANDAQDGVAPRVLL